MVVKCKSDIKIGDEVESIKKNRTYIVEEINNSTGWIWSKDFGYCEGDFNFFGPRNKYKRFRSPNGFRLSKKQIRENKLKELGLD
jgi:hypothetical protein